MKIAEKVFPKKKVKLSKGLLSIFWLIVKNNFRKSKRERDRER